MICNYLLLCLLGNLSFFISGAVGNEAIIGGEIAGERQFPYHVSVQIDEIGVCGGAIIAEHYILTAAHCIVDGFEHNELFNRVSIVAGINNLNHFGATAVRVMVQKIFFPSEYNETIAVSTGDIAVLKLKHLLNLYTHGPLQRVKLPKNQHETFVSKSGIITGFGWIWAEVIGPARIGNNTDGHLRFVHANVVDCDHDSTAAKHICAKAQQLSHFESAGTCSGDSGGLLVDYHGMAIGILTTVPKNCLETTRYAIYTRISHYLTFIRNAKENKTTRNMHAIITSD